MFSALSQQKAGGLEAAETLYRRALSMAPGTADALHMLGAICYQTERPWEAFDLIHRALELTEWQFASMRHNMGLIVAHLMRDPDAGAYERDTVDDRPRAQLWAASEKLVALARNVERHALADEQEPLRVPASSAPSVSIVIPAFDQHRYTYSCIRSIVAHTESGNYEIIVVDDASSEPVSTALAGVSGLRVVRNGVNLGFIEACNRGAMLARGDVLVLLNNDTLVTNGWLRALISALAERDVGLVGAKLIFPDGSLQEAGGIVWRDASASNCGRNDDPGKPEYNYLREVDYCSGACLAMRRSEFLALGAFDKRFAPAYYEDVDLAMRMREAGKRVVYQPAARIVHFEGVTSGSNVQQGTKRYQQINQSKFLERWRPALATHRESGVRADLEQDRGRRARILIVEAYLPVPDKDAGSLRILAVMRLLVRARCKVTFVAQNLQFLEGYGERLQQSGIEVLHFPYVWSLAQVLAQRGADFDVVWASRHPIAESLAAAVRRYAPRALFVFDTVDLHFVREAREAEITQSAALARSATLTRQKELDIVRTADVTVAVSEAERDILMEAVPEAIVHVLSNILEADERRAGFVERRDIFFVGGFNHPPNVDAVSWYASDVWPLVRTRLPEVKTFLIGSNMPQRVMALAGNGIEPLGHVPDLEPYLDGCRLSVAPLRFGAGVKGKINTAQARGVPVVATTIAVEGMHLEHGRDALVADTAQQFADAIVRLYSDESLWTSISDAALMNVQRYFSPEVAARSLERLLALAETRQAQSSRSDVTSFERTAHNPFIRGTA